jgi:hypothetical protein
MEIKKIKEYKNQVVRIFLKADDFTYVLDSLQVVDGEIEGYDIKKRKVTLSPEIIAGIVPLSGARLGNGKY